MVTPSEAPLTESPGEVLPMTQVDHPPPIIFVQDVSLVLGDPLTLATAIVLGMT